MDRGEQGPDTRPEDASPHFVVSERITITDTSHGKAWLANELIPAGTTVLIERPVAGVLDAELHKSAWRGTEGADTVGLCMRLAEIW